MHTRIFNFIQSRPALRWLLIPLLLSALLPTFRVTPVQSQSALPALIYGSYVGGDNTDVVKDVAVDAAGNLLVLGHTYSDILLGHEIARNGHSDLFVAKFNPAGTELLYLTLLGGRDAETAMSLEVDAQGNAYGTAMVFDDTFPTKNARWPAPGDDSNSVLFKLDPSGAVVYATYLPDNASDSRQNLAVDAAGNAYLVGTRWGVQEGEQFLFSQIALIKLDPTGQQLLLDRHVGGPGFENGSAITLDPQGNIYLAGYTNSAEFPVTANALQAQCGDLIFNPDGWCGQDVVMVMLTPAGVVSYASYHGGNATDEPGTIAADGQGNFAIAGETISMHFPLANALQSSCPVGDDDRCYMFRGFVSLVHLGPNGGQASLAFSTYLGANERNSISEMLDATIDSAGNVTVVGYVNGDQFPLKNAVQPEYAEGFCQTFGSVRYCFDGFVTQFSPTGELRMSTFIGGAFDEYPYGVKSDAEGNLYVAGATESFGFPTTSNGYQSSDQPGDNGFVVVIGEVTPVPTATPSQTPPTTVTPQSSVTPQTSVTPQGSVTPEASVTPRSTQTPPATTQPQPTPQSDGDTLRLPILIR